MGTDPRTSYCSCQLLCIGRPPRDSCSQLQSRVLVASYEHGLTMSWLQHITNHILELRYTMFDSWLDHYNVTFSLNEMFLAIWAWTSICVHIDSFIARHQMNLMAVTRVSHLTRALSSFIHMAMKIIQILVWMQYGLI